MSTEDFDEIYTQYYERLFYYAYGFVEDAETCRDIVANVFEQAWKENEKLRPANINSFLYSCVRNRCIDQLRHEQAAQRYLTHIRSTMTEEESESPEELEERINLVRKSIEELPARTRFVLEQCYFHNKKYREVAEILGITPDGVKKHIMKAFDLLEQQLSVLLNHKN